MKTSASTSATLDPHAPRRSALADSVTQKMGLVFCLFGAELLFQAPRLHSLLRGGTSNMLNADKKIKPAALSVIGVFCCVLLLVPFAGCGRLPALNRTAIVEAIGIDVEDGEYKLTVQIFAPGEGGSKTLDASKPNATVVEAKGGTISQAFSEISQKHGKRLFLGGNIIIVFGNGAAKRGIEDAMRFFDMNYYALPNPLVAVAQDEAGAVVSAQLKNSIVSAMSIAMMLDRTKENGNVGRVYLIDVLKGLQSAGSDIYAPILELSKNKQEEDVVSVVGTAIFREGKMADSIDPTLTRGMLWVLDEVKNTVMTIDAADFGDVSLKVNSSRTMVNAGIDYDGIPRFIINVKIQARLVEAPECEDVNALADSLGTLQDLQQKEIAGEISRAIEKVLIENGADVFRFADRLKKHHPQYWKENKDYWREILPLIRCEISVDASITSTALDGGYNF